VPVNPDELPAYLEKLLQAALGSWQGKPRNSAPPAVRSAMDRLAAPSKSLDVQIQIADHVVAAALTPCQRRDEWSDPELTAIVTGLNSVLRQLRHSFAAQEVFRLCRTISQAASVKPLGDAEAARLVAALMVVEDATSALESYRAVTSFDHVDDAYLAKFALLQALQLGFDAAQNTCAAVGIKARADATAEGKSIKITRHIVAGHPLGGTMGGKNWLHFHDRSSAHDKDTIRVMSFLDSDPSTWTGQSQSARELIDNGLQVLLGLLQQARSSFPELIPAGAPGLLFPAHEWDSREE
jgi:hypothetical protein